LFEKFETLHLVHHVSVWYYFFIVLKFRKFLLYLSAWGSDCERVVVYEVCPKSIQPINIKKK